MCPKSLRAGPATDPIQTGSAGPDRAAQSRFQAQRTINPARFLTVREVADRLRVSRATVYRLVAEGRIPAVSVSSGAIRVHQTGLPLPT
jgi:excisionase family DNA binding protein